MTEEYLTKTYSFKTDTQYHILGDPFIPGVLQEAAVSLIRHSGKESKDDGYFSPGVYRNNPYLVSSEWFDTPQLVVDVSCHQGTYTQRTLATGHLGASGLQYVQGKCAQIPPDFGNLPEQALQKAYAKVGQASVGMGENLGELRETLSMIRHPFKGLRDFLYSTNYRNLGLLNKLTHYNNTKNKYGVGRWLGGTSMTSRQAAQAAADAWLELRYGLRPLVYSVQDVIDLVDKGLRQFKPDVIVSARSLKAKAGKLRIEPFGYQPGVQFNCTAVATEQLQVNASVHYRQLADRTYMDALALKPQYLPELAWELTRLSFVVDWWFDVGTWLSCLRFDPKFEVLGNAVGEKVERNVVLSADAKYTNCSDDTRTAVGTIGTYHSSRYERKVDQHLPLFPLFTLHLPGLSESADYAALILQPVLNNIRR